MVSQVRAVNAAGHGHQYRMLQRGQAKSEKGTTELNKEAVSDFVEDLSGVVGDRPNGNE